MTDLNGFLGKIGWEGGIDEALDYGLTVDKYNLPNDLRDAWNELRRLHAEYEEKREAALGIINDALEEAGY